MSNDVISGSKNGKKYTIDKSKSTGNATYKKASGANNFKIGDNVKDHLVNSEGFVLKKGKGVVGGHNIDSFYDELGKQSFNIDDCVIAKTPHSSVEGVYEIKYQVPAMDNKGNVIPNQYKNIDRPKTVYDSSIISDDTMFDLGVEAMQNGKINGREVTGTASNGLKFKGFLNESGEITNFYPQLPTEN